MDIAELIRSVGESFGASASVKNVYGEPVTSGGRTVIPVAKIRYTFGAGGGRRRAGDPAKTGAGGGGAMWARPAGIVEITPEGARFIRFHQPARLAIAAGAGFLLGAAWAFRRRGNQASV